jgi:hypothetical protein
VRKEPFVNNCKIEILIRRRRRRLDEEKRERKKERKKEERGKSFFGQLLLPVS